MPNVFRLAKLFYCVPNLLRFVLEFIVETSDLKKAMESHSEPHILNHYYSEAASALSLAILFLLLLNDFKVIRKLLFARSLWVIGLTVCGIMFVWGFLFGIGRPFIGQRGFW